MLRCGRIGAVWGRGRLINLICPRLLDMYRHTHPNSRRTCSPLSSSCSPSSILRRPTLISLRLDPTWTTPNLPSRATTLISSAPQARSAGHGVNHVYHTPSSYWPRAWPRSQHRGPLRFRGRFPRLSRSTSAYQHSSTDRSSVCLLRHSRECCLVLTMASTFQH